MSNLKSLIGNGIQFPFTSTDSKGVKMNDLIERINQSLFILFETPRGSRLMLPEYGSNINRHKFEPNDSILYDRLREEMLSDIRRWEPRIVVSSIDFYADSTTVDNNTLYIQINYTIINTETKGNFVYPYMKETYDSITSK